MSRFVNLPHRARLTASLLAGSLALTACATPPPGRTYTRENFPPPPSTQVYAYPARGQLADQQDRDRYECHQWAIQQSGYDPARPRTVATTRRVTVEREPTAGANTAAGLLAGAAIGSALADRGHGPEGAVLGAIAGAVIGASADAAQEQSARVVEREYRAAPYTPNAERQAANFRRAMSACLEGRGYQVR